MPYPVEAILPDLIARLDDGPNAVLVAPPGAGKTTIVPPALLTRPWAGGTILLLSPRRLAARAAAERMAALAGEPVGRTIGYRTRLDSKVSAATRIEVVTEGIFTRRILADPELAGVAAVLFDEAHERSLDGDLGLALALEAQEALRPDLRLVVMSATLDGAAYARLMPGAQVVESEGRAFPLAHHYLGRRPDERIEDAVAAAIHRALAEEDGSILAFLPGVAEIERTAERLRVPADAEVHRLHGSLDPAGQRAAIAPAPAGRRKIVLATSIAETSITIDGVRIVVDSGLSRRPRYDRGAGVTRLVTERASRAAVDQRAGRAGRTAPGTVYRLWDEAQTRSLPAYDPPEITEADLSGLCLDLALWGVSDPASLAWLDPPPAAGIAEARDRLTLLGALDADGRGTAHGAAVARLPLAPRLAHMLIAAHDHGIAATAARVAVLLGERGLGGPGVDIDPRLRRFADERGPRAVAARRLAERWRTLAGGGDDSDTPMDAAGLAIALAYPDRVARRRSGDGGDYASTGGRGFRLDPADPLARAEWLAVAEVQGAAQGARILAAAAIDAATVEALFTDRITTRRDVRFDAATGGVVAERRRMLGALTLGRGADPDAPADAIAEALLAGLRDEGLDRLPWGEAAIALRQRAAAARAAGFDLAALDDAALLADLADWAPPLLAGRRRLDAVSPAGLHDALVAQLGWQGQQLLDRVAPTRLATPAGTSHAIDYGADGGPTVTMRVQELFGLARHPMVMDGRVPLILSLTSPAGRPIQTTRDLPGFWSGSWRDVAKEMRGRYPRHPWPDDPAAAAATTRTKRAEARRSS